MKNALDDHAAVSGNAGSSRPAPSFGLLFYTDVREEVSNAEKIQFVQDAVIFGDQAGFESVYMPERHFHNSGCIFPDPAVLASYLAPQTKRIRFRTAGLSLPLHHPATMVESWAMVDNLSGGRVDLGFGNGGSFKPLFVLAREGFEARKTNTSDGIPIIQRLWRGETLQFKDPDGEEHPITVHPRPLQKEVAIWLLVVRNDEAFEYAGRQGYNIMTMLYDIDLEGIGRKILRYRAGRKEAGLDPATGVVSIMLHTLVHDDPRIVREQLAASFRPFVDKLAARKYAMEHNGQRIESLGEDERAHFLEETYREHLRDRGIFGSLDEAGRMVDRVLAVGANDIAMLIDYGVDYGIMRDSFAHLAQLVARYRPPAGNS